MKIEDLTGEQRELLDGFNAQKRVALTRVISIVENQRPGFRAILNELHEKLGRAHRIGITGPPGAGKSTLTAALIAHYRSRGETVAVIAVDPTSPFTGGALLGDRIRMNEIAMDSGVFIRSMATRGSLGGLALTTKEVADVMDAYGFDRVLVETVGVGQSELDIASAADSTVVVLVPESGDGIQAMKAGLMEAADLFVVNKSDRPGADRLAREVSMMLHLRSGQLMRNIPAHHGVDKARVRARRSGAGDIAAAATSAAAATGASDAASRAAATGASDAASPEAATGAPHAASPAADSAGSGSSASTTAAAPDSAAWEIPVLKTIAEKAEGVPELADVLERHRGWLGESGELGRRRRQRLAERVKDEVARSLLRRTWAEQGGEQALESALPALEAGETTPYEVAARIVDGA